MAGNEETFLGISKESLKKILKPLGIIGLALLGLAAIA